MTKTFKQLREMDMLYAKLLVNKNFAETKLHYAFKRFSDSTLIPNYKSYNLILEGIRIENALTDKTTGALLYRAGTEDYEYNKEGKTTVLKKLQEVEEEWDKKDIEIVPYICKDSSPIKLTQEEKELLDGAILDLNNTAAEATV